MSGIDSDYKALPSVDKLLRSEILKDIVDHWGLAATTDAIRALQAAQRVESKAVNIAAYPKLVLEWLNNNREHGYKTVFNLTGTIIHTNLGRSLIGKELIERAMVSATRPVTLEYNLNHGRRGNREGVIKEQLRRMTGAEDATVVNNNAGALLLTLNTLAEGREVLVSRGELIEIGGSFRLPDIMAKANCKLVEVGTTNRTHTKDFSGALTDSSALLLKVHPSNYAINGFTRSVNETDLVSLGEERDIPVILDLGSGALIDLQRFGLPREPLPQDSLTRGVDLVTFSGDKLLGGIQAGFVVGRRELIERLDANPLKRALRMDKLSLAIVNETLKAYENPDQLSKTIPLFEQLSVSDKTLRHRAKLVSDVIRDVLSHFKVEVVSSEAEIGSGAMPVEPISSIAVAVSHKDQQQIQDLEDRLRDLNPAVIARIYKGRLLMDMRGADPLDELTQSLMDLK